MSARPTLAAIIIGLGLGLARADATEGRAAPSPETQSLPYTGRARPALDPAPSGEASVIAYDCSFVQSGFIAINPCTGNAITEHAQGTCIGTRSRRPDGVVIDSRYNTSVQSRWTDSVTGEVFRLKGDGVVVFSEANNMTGITIFFRGLARGRHSDIVVDWHGLIAIDSATGEVSEAGVPGPTFSDGMTCVRKDSDPDDEK